MHQMQTIVTDVCGVCPSVRLHVNPLNSASLCEGHSVQSLPNHFGLLSKPYRLYKSRLSQIKVLAVKLVFRKRRLHVDIVTDILRHRRERKVAYALRDAICCVASGNESRQVTVSSSE